MSYEDRTFREEYEQQAEQPEYQDKKITCADKGKREGCEGEFVFTAGEQEFYADKGISPTTRCKSCRAKRKAEREKEANEKFGRSY